MTITAAASMVAIAYLKCLNEDFSKIFLRYYEISLWYSCKSLS